MNPPPYQSLLRTGEDAHIYDYLNVILRRRKIFALGLIAVFFYVAVNNYYLKPVYTASATLRIKGGGTMLGGMSFDSSNPIDTEIEIIRSRTNAEHVVRHLHLDWQVTNKSEGLTFKLLDFSSTAKNPSYQIDLTGGKAFTVKDEEGRVVGQGQAGVLMQGKDITLFLTDLHGGLGDSFQLRLLLSLDYLAESLRGGFSVSEVGNKTGIMRISYSSTDPVEARDMVNTLMQVYMEQALALKAEEASRTISFIEDQLRSLRGEMDSSESNLGAYKISSGMFKLDSEAQAIVSKMADMDKARAELSLQKKQMEFALAALQEAARRGVPYSPTITGDDTLTTSIAQKIVELETQKRALLKDFTENHPAVKNIQLQIEEMQKKIHIAYEANLKKLSGQETTLNQQMTVTEQKLHELPTAQRELARLTRIATVNSASYSFFLQKREEARIAKAATISNINIVDPAITPTSPVSPNKKKNLLMGFLFGCVLGIGLAFFQEYLDDTIKDAEGAKRATGFPLMAVIPFIPSRKENGSAKKKASIITLAEPKSQVSESFRSLRTSLHFTAANQDKKIILVTSTFPGEGKTTVAANLTNILSQAHLRVLIIDCDLRRSSIHENFGVEKVPGLTEHLSGDVTFADISHHSEITGIDVITAGTTPPNPAELLGSEAMRQFLQAQRDNYDHIIIDAPPVLAVTDAPVLTTMSDMVLVVMEAGRVPVKAAKRMHEMLANINAPVAGLVINDKTGRGESYGYYGSRYYRYGYGYRHGYGYGYGKGYYSDDENIPPKTHWWTKFIPQKHKKKRMKKTHKTKEKVQH